MLPYIALGVMILLILFFVVQLLSAEKNQSRERLRARLAETEAIADNAHASLAARKQRHEAHMQATLAATTPRRAMGFMPGAAALDDLQPDFYAAAGRSESVDPGSTSFSSSFLDDEPMSPMMGTPGSGTGTMAGGIDLSDPTTYM